MAPVSSPLLTFTEEFNEILAHEVEQKGWCGIGIVELPSGDRINVFFYDPVRLAQDLASDTQSGDAFIAEPGLIIVPKVTLAYMEGAVKKLFEKGYFKNLLPISKGGNAI